MVSVAAKTLEKSVGRKEVKGSGPLVLSGKDFVALHGSLESQKQLSAWAGWKVHDIPSVRVSFIIMLHLGGG